MKKIFFILVLMIVSSVIFIVSCTKEPEIIEEKTNTTQQIVDDVMLKNGNVNIHLYARYGDNGYSKMIIKKKDNNNVVDIKVLDKTNMPLDAVYSVSTHSSLIDTLKQTITIPDDGKQYWIISFDPNRGDKDVVYKAQVGAGGGPVTISFTCECDFGDCIAGISPCCTVKYKSNPNGTITIYCKNDACYAACRVKQSGGSYGLRSYVIVSGEIISYNGVIYDKDCKVPPC